MTMHTINPASLGAPRGYSNGVVLQGSRVLFVAGQIGWDSNQSLVEGGFVPQFEQALRNVATVVAEAGASIDRVGRLTMYVTDKHVYSANIKEIGAAYRRIFDKHYPAMALVQVADLLEPGALVEIEATAVF